MTGSDHTVLVVGSYPPVPTASTGATLDAVRRAWREGKATVVASPRPSAADLTARVDGPLAGLHLRHAQQASGADQVVLSTEPGLPVHLRAGPLAAVEGWLTCALLARALDGFDHVTVVENGFGPSQVPGWNLVRARADEVLSRPEERGTEGVHPVPSLAETAEQYRAMARLVVKRLLGPGAPTYARLARRGVAAVRSLR